MILKCFLIVDNIHMRHCFHLFSPLLLTYEGAVVSHVHLTLCYIIYNAHSTVLYAQGPAVVSGVWRKSVRFIELEWRCDYGAPARYFHPFTYYSITFSLSSWGLSAVQLVYPVPLTQQCNFL